MVLVASGGQGRWGRGQGHLPNTFPATVELGALVPASLCSSGLATTFGQTFPSQGLGLLPYQRKNPFQLQHILNADSRCRVWGQATAG